LLDEGDPDDDVRAQAARSLGQLGEAAAEYAGCLAALLDDDQSELVRAAAAEALGKIGKAAWPHIGAVARALDDANVAVRWRAVSTLGRVGEPAKPYAKDIALLLVGPEPDSYVRQGAAMALGRLGEASMPFLSALIAAKNDEDVHVARWAVTSLKKLQDYKKQLVKAKEEIEEPEGAAEAPLSGVVTSKARSRSPRRRRRKVRVVKHEEEEGNTDNLEAVQLNASGLSAQNKNKTVLACV